MQKTINIIILTLTLIVSEGCEEVYTTTFANRNLFVFMSAENAEEREYFMTLEMRSEKWKYTYENKEDPEKSMEFNYIIESDILKFALSEYESVNGTEFTMEELPEFTFKKYQLTEPIDDGTEPIIFNPKYGVLAIGNVQAPDFVFLRKKMDLKIAKSIITVLNH